MREKGKMKKESKILIRANKKEKAEIEKDAKAEGMNVSEYIRWLSREKQTVNKFIETHYIVSKVPGFRLSLIKEDVKRIKPDEIKHILDNLMTMVSQSMHYKEQCKKTTAPVLTPDGDGYFSPLCGTVLKIGSKKEHLKTYTDKILATLRRF